MGRRGGSARRWRALDDGSPEYRGTLMASTMEREAVREAPNPIGFDGIEFIEFATSRPQALGGFLEQLGFQVVARHRSREVELYRQGQMNLIVNAQPADVPRAVQPVERPVISAFAVRVRDADYAFRRALDLGAWEIPVRARAMELNIPAIHGVGESLIYLIDRYDEFSIYDIDFRPIHSSKPPPTPIEGLHFFGIVQYIGASRTADWVEFYSRLFGFVLIPDRVRFGILPKGHLLESPGHTFYLQLIEPEAAVSDVEWENHFRGTASGPPKCPTMSKNFTRRGSNLVPRISRPPAAAGALPKPL